MADQKPLKVFKIGAVQAAIFRNAVEVEGVRKEIPSVSFQKRYTDKDGVWQTTNKLNTNDIPRAILVLMEAYRYLSLSESHAS